jgi:hypothetical protein
VSTIADCVVFPAGGATVSAPLQLVPDPPEAHCAKEIPDKTKIMNARMIE